MSAHASALASAEVLLTHAIDLVQDAARTLDDAGEKKSAQALNTLAAEGEIALERLRRKRLTAEAFSAEWAND